MRFLASVLKASTFGVQIKVVDALLEPRGISPSSALEGNPFGVVAALLQPRGLTGHFVVSPRSTGSRRRSLRELGGCQAGRRQLVP